MGNVLQLVTQPRPTNSTGQPDLLAALHAASLKNHTRAGQFAGTRQSNSGALVGGGSFGTGVAVTSKHIAKSAANKSLLTV